MKKWIALVLCILMVLPSLAVAQEEKVVNILSWVGYIDDDTLAAFEAETGIKVIWSPMDSIDSMLLKVMESGTADYDLILTSDYSLDILRQQGLIQKLDKSLLPNYANLDEAFLSQSYDPENEYVVPYTAGSPLIIYDPDTVGFEITGYEDLWHESLVGSVALLDNARVNCGIALKTMGRSFNETDPAVLEQMREKLYELRPNLRTANDIESYTAIATGDASVGFLFTSHINLVQTDRVDMGLEPMTIVYPKEGLGFGIDGLVLTAESKNPENAHAFLNYLMRPEVAAHNAEMQMYMCVNKAAAPFLSETYRNTPEFNIPAEILAEAEMIEALGATETLYMEIYTAFLNH